MTEKNEPETDKLDNISIDDALLAAVNNGDCDDDCCQSVLASEVRRLRQDGWLAKAAREEAERKLAAEVERLRAANHAILDEFASQAREITRLQKALEDEKSLTAATAEHTAQLEAKLKWFEDAWPYMQTAIADYDDIAAVDAANEWLEKNPKPGATT